MNSNQKSYLNKMNGIPVKDRKEIYLEMCKPVSILDLIRVMQYFGIKEIELESVSEKDFALLESQKFKSYVSDVSNISIDVEITDIEYDSMGEELVAKYLKITLK